MGFQKTDLITDYYAEQNRLLHESMNWGESGRKYAKFVDKFAKDLYARTVLDYGCGRGTLRRALLDGGFLPPVREYDPALPGFNDLPYPADLVVCTDVMEHVEPELIDNVLRHIEELSIKGCYMVIATRDCDHRLPDGRSTHLTVEGPIWWIDRVQRATKFNRYDFKIHKNEENNTEKKVTIWMRK